MHMYWSFCSWFSLQASAPCGTTSLPFRSLLISNVSTLPGILITFPVSHYLKRLTFTRAMIISSAFTLLGLWLCASLLPCGTGTKNISSSSPSAAAHESYMRMRSGMYSGIHANTPTRFHANVRSDMGSDIRSAMPSGMYTGMHAGKLNSRYSFDTDKASGISSLELAKANLPLSFMTSKSSSNQVQNFVDLAAERESAQERERAHDHETESSSDSFEEISSERIPFSLSPLSSSSQETQGEDQSEEGESCSLSPLSHILMIVFVSFAQNATGAAYTAVVMYTSEVRERENRK